MATEKTKTKKVVEKKDDAKKSKTHPLVIGARITEKSAIASDRGAYTFNVVPHATKNEIKKAIKMLYGVTPVKVSMVKISEKKVFRGRVQGVKKGGKKAVVHLKKGDKITFA